eukprot:TRINITY_DN6055_c0_g1_i2.p1 TRINITY_DN6055_c0_g1~~TRINITY_DN6055_c0_g1_i2.p1  ORF type:complete len:337 (+),score=62.58 TRINITY_DN6055_c0_g1_i2:91-1101(+)
MPSSPRSRATGRLPLPPLRDACADDAGPLRSGHCCSPLPAPPDVPRAPGPPDKLRCRDVVWEILSFATANGETDDPACAVSRLWRQAWRSEAIWRHRLAALWRRPLLSPPFPYETYRAAWAACRPATALGGAQVVRPAAPEQKGPQLLQRPLAEAAEQLTVTLAARLVCPERAPADQSVVLLTACSPDNTNGGEVALLLNRGRPALRINTAGGGAGGVWPLGKERVDDGGEHHVAVVVAPQQLRSSPGKCSWLAVRASAYIDGRECCSRNMVCVPKPGLVRNHKATVSCPPSPPEAAGLEVREAALWPAALPPRCVQAAAHIGFRSPEGAACTGAD